MRSVIFANGELAHPQAALKIIGSEDLLIAADGGARHLLRLGLSPQIVIGDFDSLDEQELHDLQADGVEIIRHPARKDFTDLELALQLAQERGAEEAIVVAGLGQRWDQSLANMLLPAASALQRMRVRMLDGPQEMFLIRGGEKAAIPGLPGDTVSLIPVNGPAQGITTTGLEYPLDGGSLEFGSTRGISNVLLREGASVELERGLLLCAVIHQEE